jgi:hypothetical protein
MATLHVVVNAHDIFDLRMFFSDATATDFRAQALDDLVHWRQNSRMSMTYVRSLNDVSSGSFILP